MISHEEKVRLLDLTSDPSSNASAWVATVIRHFIDEYDANEKRLFELDEALIETMMRY